MACSIDGDEAIQIAPTSTAKPTIEMNAEERMWARYLAEQNAGRTPTGADLDRIAGTHNYGRRILRKWRDEGLLRSTSTSEVVVEGKHQTSSGRCVTTT